MSCHVVSEVLPSSVISGKGACYGKLSRDRIRVVQKGLVTKCEPDVSRAL